MSSVEKEKLSLVANDASRRPKRTRAAAIRDLVPGTSEPLAKLLAEIFSPSDASSQEPPVLAVPPRDSRVADEPRSQSLIDQFSSDMTLAGTAASYGIRELLCRGDYRDTYVAAVVARADGLGALPDGGRVVIKNPRVPDDMSDDAGADRLSTVGALLLKESEDLRRLDGVPGVARFLDRGEYVHCLQSVSRPSVFFVQEYIDGYDLRDYAASHFGVNGHFSGIQAAPMFFQWARFLTNTVHEIHKRLVMHGSICPENIRVNLQHQPVLVDFGERLFPQVMDSTAYLGDQAERYRAPERARGVGEDLYSLGGVLHYLATGEDPPKPYEDIEVLKAQVENTIRNNNESLFRSSCGVADIIARCLRYSRAGRVENAAALLRDIDTFDVAGVSEKVVEEATTLLEQARELEATGQSLFCWMAVLRTRELGNLIDDMRRGVYDLTGSPDDMRGAAANLMSVLVEGDEYLSISVPKFWWPENIGLKGRFLSKYKEAAARGVTVRRVFLLDETLSDPYLEDIVSTHQRISVELKYRSNFSVRYILLSADEREQFVRGGRHFGLFLKQGSSTAMFPQYRANETMEMLRFRTDPAIVKGLRRIFERENARATSLADLKLPAIKVG